MEESLDYSTTWQQQWARENKEEQTPAQEGKHNF